MISSLQIEARESSERIELLQRSNEQLVSREKELNEQIVVEKANCTRISIELEEKMKLVDQVEVLQQLNQQLATKEKEMKEKLRSEQTNIARLTQELG